MNILFFIPNISPSVGGAERVTNLQAQLFTTKGHNCYAVHVDGNPEGYFVKTLIIPDLSSIPRKRDVEVTDRIVSFAQENAIDVIIDECEWELTRYNEILRIVANKIEKKLINYFHNKVASSNEVKAQVRQIVWNQKFTTKKLIKQVLFPAYFWLWNRRIQKHYDYKRRYELCDSMVLLSEGFIDRATQEITKGDRRKIVVIPNPVTFQTTVPASIVDSKERLVLIVARMYDGAKNISTALKIWHELSSRDNFDWRLEVVGDGPDLVNYKKQVAKSQIKNVEFKGFVADLEELAQYYRRAAIFMMTSNYEGFGLTLIEAQHYGCVPIVFDTFATVYDIIMDAKTGFIIAPGRNDLYAKALQRLAMDDRLRLQMAHDAMLSVQRFSLESHYSYWEQLFKQVL